VEHISGHLTYCSLSLKASDEVPVIVRDRLIWLHTTFSCARYFRLPPRPEWDLLYSGTLRSVEY